MNARNGEEIKRTPLVEIQGARFSGESASKQYLNAAPNIRAKIEFMRSF